jgi:L-alanine-DL-glutamate epimerase-like enolase superfamily enzyme
MTSLDPTPTVGSTTSTLTVERVEAVPIVAPLARKFQGSHYSMTQRATVIVRLFTKEGVVGEAYVGDEVDTLGQIVKVIEQEITPRLLGANLMATQRIWELLYPVTFDILRDRRVGLVAQAGVDSAMWDAVGKSLGQPLHVLWGGYRDSIPMIAIGGYYGEPLGAIEDEIDYYLSVGLAGVKFKIGGADPLIDAARVARAREAAGDDFIIAVDANQGYSVADAVAFCRAAADLGIRWFEEPVGWANDRRDLATVRALGGIPVTAGQSELSPTGCRELMEAGAIDVCNFDASWSGGPTSWLRTAAVAHTFSVQMGHHEEPQISSHLLSSQPHGTYAECFHPDRDPFWWNLIANRPALENGTITLPSAPGLGWTLDADYIARHRVDR